MMKLIVVDGEMAGEEFPLTSDYISIGREEGVDIHLPTDTSVSRKHAVVRKEFGKYILEDLGSTNGTFLVKPDGEEEEIIQTVLTENKTFRVGKTKLKLIRSVKDLVIDTREDEDMEVVADTPDDFAIRSSIDPDEVYHTNFLMVPEDKKAVEELNHKIKVFYEIGMALSRSMDLDEILGKILDKIFDMFPAQRGFLMLLNEDTNELETKVVKRRNQPDMQDIEDKDKIEVSRTIINHVLKEKKAILSDDARIDERFGMPDSVFLHDIRATMYVPLMVEKRIIGVLCVDSFTSSHVFEDNDLKLLSIIANQASQSIENARLHQNLRKLFVSSIRALANAIEARDVYTRGHSERVTEYSVKIAKKMKLDKEEIEKIQYAALLHDIGKINIREDILNKPGRLTDEEFYIMRQHPVYGARIMEPVMEFKEILPYVYHHHERFDKKGYPDGLGGENIPLASRILAVADSFDAMTSDRPYRNAMSIEEAIKELDNNSGTQFDPRAVNLFKEIVETERDWLDRVLKTGLDETRQISSMRWLDSIGSEKQQIENEEENE